jgi:fibronectin type 3 domain-containing protein
MQASATGATVGDGAAVVASASIQQAVPLGARASSLHVVATVDVGSVVKPTTSDAPYVSAEVAVPCSSGTCHGYGSQLATSTGRLTLDMLVTDPGGYLDAGSAVVSVGVHTSAVLISGCLDVVCPSPPPNGVAGASASSIDAVLSSVTVTTDDAALAPIFWASSGIGRTELMWIAPSSATPISAYRIYRNGSLFTSVSGSATSYSDTTAVAGVGYDYAVAAVNAVGEGPRSGTSAAAAYLPPQPPTGVAATSAPCDQWESAGVRLSWTPAPDDPARPRWEYEVHRTPDWGSSERASGMATTFTDCSVTPGATYEYWLVPLGYGYAPGAASAHATVTPGPYVSSDPTTPSASATPIGPTSIRLDWTVPTVEAPLLGYEIRLGEGPCADQDCVSDAPSAFVGADRTSWVDDAAKPGVTRHYRVTAVYPAGVGKTSNLASATTVAAPSAPALSGGGYTSSKRDHGVALDWWVTNANGSPVTSFRLYRTPPGGTESLLATFDGSASSYRDHQVTAGTSYTYRIRATNRVGDSPMSAPLTVTAG